MGRAASSPEPPSTQIMSRPSPVRPRFVEMGEEALPLGGAFAARQTIVDHLLLAVMPQAQSHQHRAAQRLGPGLAGEHDAVEHQRPSRPLSGRAWNASIALSRLFATRLSVVRADRPAEQDLAKLTGRKPEHETRQD